MCVCVCVYTRTRARAHTHTRAGAVACLLQPGLPFRRDLAFTRYCHLQYCMVYSKTRRSQWAGVYCAMLVQDYCNRVGIAGGGGAIKG